LLFLALTLAISPKSCGYSSHVNYIWLLLIISIGFKFYGSSNLLWCLPFCLSCADVCAGSTPYP
jgi:hypothetical protein